MAATDNTLNQDDLCKLMGYENPGMAEKKLREQGIVPIYGRPGHYFVTLQMLNAARGIGVDGGRAANGNDELL